MASKLSAQTFLINTAKTNLKKTTIQNEKSNGDDVITFQTLPNKEDPTENYYFCRQYYGEAKADLYYIQSHSEVMSKSTYDVHMATCTIIDFNSKNNRITYKIESHSERKIYILEMNQTSNKFYSDVLINEHEYIKALYHLGAFNSEFV